MAMDYTFKIPATVNAGLMVVNFMNDGKEPHELTFIRLNDGVTVKQFQTQLEAFPPKAFLLSKWLGFTKKVQQRSIPKYGTSLRRKEMLDV